MGEVLEIRDLRVKVEDKEILKGVDLTVEQGREAARQAGLNMLTTIRTALGSLDRVKRVVKVLGMVISSDGIWSEPVPRQSPGSPGEWR